LVEGGPGERHTIGLETGNRDVANYEIYMVGWYCTLVFGKSGDTLGSRGREVWA
jgi:hypothetical protein